MPIIEDPNHDFSVNTHSPSFLSHNGLEAPLFKNSDIEMITIPAVRYTSLKDIMTDLQPQAAVLSPVNNSSWYEVPIKNPLVKQAALAYLQPMSTPPDVGNNGLFQKLIEKCLCRGGDLGCLDWLSGVVLEKMKDFFIKFCGRGYIENSEFGEQEAEEEGQG